MTFEEWLRVTKKTGQLWKFSKMYSVDFEKLAKAIWDASRQHMTTRDI